MYAYNILFNIKNKNSQYLQQDAKYAALNKRS